MCGLCGNMDGALKNDLTGPRQVAYPESRSMASTYLIPSGRCDPRSLQKDFKVPEIRRQSSEFSRSELLAFFFFMNSAHSKTNSILSQTFHL